MLSLIGWVADRLPHNKKLLGALKVRRAQAADKIPEDILRVMEMLRERVPEGLEIRPMGYSILVYDQGIPIVAIHFDPERKQRIQVSYEGSLQFFFSDTPKGQEELIDEVVCQLTAEPTGGPVGGVEAIPVA